MSVVLPAPVGPMSVKTSPLSTLKLTFLSISLPSNFWDKLTVSIKAICFSLLLQSVESDVHQQSHKDQDYAQSY